MNKTYFLLLIFLLLFSCKDEIKGKEIVQESPFVNVEKTNGNYSIDYYKSFNKFTLEGENKLHIDSVSYPYIKREQSPESYWIYSFVYSRLEKKEIRVAWDESKKCYYKLRDFEPENTKWIEQHEEFYLDSFKLTILSVNDVRNSDHFIEYFTVTKGFEAITYIPIHKSNNYNQLHLRDVDTFIKNNEFAYITTINYETKDNVLYLEYERMDIWDGTTEKVSSCFQLNGYDSFWWHNFPSFFDKCKMTAEK